MTTDTPTPRIHDLRGRVALVTGAGSGIGAASAALLAESGARTALLDRETSRLEKVSERIAALGREALVVPADVSDARAVPSAFEKVIAHFGRLDVVVAAAGINGVWGPLDEISPEEWDRTMAVNLRGAFLILQAAATHLRVRGGSVVFVASINGSRTFNNVGASAYAASKAGQIALAKMAALEFARDGIRVNVICPGSIQTRIDETTVWRSREKVKREATAHHGRIPLGNGTPGTARQVAELVSFLASDQASHITGSEVYIDGGESLAG